MTDKAKKQDLQIWTRMGRELAALHDLIVHIICDPDYNDVMDKRTWGRLNGLTYHLDTVRSRAEDRMARYVPDWSTRTFYPRDRGDLEAAIQDFRQKMDNGTGGEQKKCVTNFVRFYTLVQMRSAEKSAARGGMKIALPAIFAR